MVYIALFVGQWIYQKAFLTWLRQYIYLFSISFSIDFARWKSVVLPHIVYIVTQKIKFSIKDFFSKCDQICCGQIYWRNP